MRLRQFADDSRLILPINPDKAPKSRRLTVFTLMRLRQFADDSRLILPVNPDKAPKADDSRLILPINPDKAHQVRGTLHYI